MNTRKLLDLLERTAWTAAQAFAASVAATDIITGHVQWKPVLVTAAIAAGAAAAKVVTAQNFTANGLGDTLPQQVAPAAAPSPVKAPAGYWGSVPAAPTTHPTV